MKFTSLLLLFIFLTPVSGIQIYDAEVRFLNGEDHKLSIYKDRTLLIDLMASWCNPCEIQAKKFVENYDSIRQKMNIISISVSPFSDTIEVLNESKTRINATWPYAIDIYNDVFDIYNPSILPTLILINNVGAIIERFEGVTEIDQLLDSIKTNDHVLPILTLPLIIAIIAVNLKKRLRN